MNTMTKKIQFDSIRSSTGKVHPAFTSDHETDRAAGKWLYLNSKFGDFEMSLCEAERRSFDEDRPMSPAQRYWLHKLATQTRSSHAPSKVTIATGKIDSMLNHAKTRLKYPKFQSTSADGKHSIKVSQASPNSKFAGSFTVAHPTFGQGFYGTISNGEFRPTRQCTAEIESLVLEFADDPAAAAASYGRLTGNCCFCMRPLSTDSSVAAGYGPVCAEHFGLPWGSINRSDLPEEEEFDGAPNITEDQLCDMAYECGLSGELSSECPHRIDGLRIPQTIENAKLWRMCWRDGQEEAGTQQADAEFMAIVDPQD
jgi:hypothetical protein